MPRNLNFPSLISSNPSLADYYDEKSNRFNFRSNQAVVALTETLFDTELHLQVKISPDRLCPRFFNRLDYIEFVEKLLSLTEFPTETHQYHYCGLDIGTGQVAVYPLMAERRWNKCELHWFMGTDIDKDTVKLALSNVARNKLSEKILISFVDAKDNCFKEFAGKLREDDDPDVVGFTVCNPPFYSSVAEMEAKRRLKRDDVGAVVGTTNELITEGGELGFVRRLIEDSKSIKLVRWFTCLIGNYSTVEAIVKGDFSEDPNFNFGVYEFVSGSSIKSTKIWIIYWSHQSIRPPMELFKTRLVSPKFEYIITGLVRDPEILVSKIRDLPCLEKIQTDRGIIVHLPGDCWSRAYRRRGKKVKKESIWVEVVIGKDVTVYWRYGREYKVFESFCGWITRSRVESVRNNNEVGV